jgi:excisionase family DNA binding protein
MADTGRASQDRLTAVTFGQKRLITDETEERMTCTRRGSGPEWLSLKQIADELGLALRTIYNRRNRGDGPRAYRIGGKVRVKRSDLDAWLESQVDDRGAA